MDPNSERLRNQLLDAAANGSSRHAQYQLKVNTMLSDLEASVRREKWVVGIQWVFLVALTTAFMIIGGYHIDKTTAGLWFGIQGVLWLLIGAVFLLSSRFSQLKLDLLKEIKQVELAVREVQEKLNQ